MTFDWLAVDLFWGIVFMSLGLLGRLDEKWSLRMLGIGLILLTIYVGVGL